MERQKDDRITQLLCDQIIEEIREIFESGKLTHPFGFGKYLLRLEAFLADSHRFKHCITFSGGTPNLLKKVLAINGLNSLYDKIERICFIRNTTCWALYTNNEEASTIFKRLRAHGYDFEGEYDHDYLGLGIRPSEITAVVLYHLERAK